VTPLVRSTRHPEATKRSLPRDPAQLRRVALPPVLQMSSRTQLLEQQQRRPPLQKMRW
jgi:hypothetical protein